MKPVMLVTIHLSLQLDSEMPDERGLTPEAIQAALVAADEAARHTKHLGDVLQAQPGVLKVNPEPTAMCSRAEYDALMAQHTAAQPDLATLPVQGHA